MRQFRSRADGRRRNKFLETFPIIIDALAGFFSAKDAGFTTTVSSLAPSKLGRSINMALLAEGESGVSLPGL
jgi:hypothetical protein